MVLADQSQSVLTRFERTYLSSFKDTQLVILEARASEARAPLGESTPGALWETRCLGAQRAKIKSSSVDVIVLNDMSATAQHPLALISDLARLLKINGVLFCIAPLPAAGLYADWAMLEVVETSPETGTLFQKDNLGPTGNAQRARRLKLSQAAEQCLNWCDASQPLIEAHAPFESFGSQMLETESTDTLSGSSHPA